MRLPGRALNQIYCASITKVICQWLLIPGKFLWFYIRGSHAWSFSALGKFESRLKESRGTKEMLWILAAKQWKGKRKEAEKEARERERERMCINHILRKNPGLDSKAWIFTKQTFIVVLWCNISYTLWWWTANEVSVSYVSPFLWEFRIHWVLFILYAVSFKVRWWKCLFSTLKTPVQQKWKCLLFIKEAYLQYTIIYKYLQIQG